jgi:hypothetical protein
MSEFTDKVKGENARMLAELEKGLMDAFDKNDDAFEQLSWDLQRAKSSTEEKWKKSLNNLTGKHNEFFKIGRKYTCRRRIAVNNEEEYDFYDAENNSLYEGSEHGRYEVLYSRLPQFTDLFPMSGNEVTCTKMVENGYQEYILEYDSVNGAWFDKSIAEEVVADAFKQVLHEEFNVDVDMESAIFIAEMCTKTLGFGEAYFFSAVIYDSYDGIHFGRIATAIDELLKCMHIDFRGSGYKKYDDNLKKCLNIFCGRVTADIILQVARSYQLEIRFENKYGRGGILLLDRDGNYQELDSNELYVAARKLLKEQCGRGENSKFSDNDKLKKYFHDKIDVGMENDEFGYPEAKFTF